jgi:leucyl aminopeptidase (aminopeptidase T)
LGGATNTGKTWDWSAEAVEEDLNRLIEKRAREAGAAHERSRMWAESVRRYNLAHSADRRREWVQYHRQQAERHRAALAALVARHEAAAAALLAADGGGDPYG